MSSHKSAPRPKHIPMRSCVVCRQKSIKRDLTRVVYSVDGLQVDPTGKMNGRGAYICQATQCWERIMHTDMLSKALKTRLTNDDYGRLNDVRP